MSTRLSPVTYLTPLIRNEAEAGVATLSFYAPGWLAVFRSPRAKRNQHTELQLHITASNEGKAQRALDAIRSAHGILEFEADDDPVPMVYRPEGDYRRG